MSARQLASILTSDAAGISGTSFDALRDVSPMLASRSGLDTAESSLEEVAATLAAAALAEDDA